VDLASVRGAAVLMGDEEERMEQEPRPFLWRATFSTEGGDVSGLELEVGDEMTSQHLPDSAQVYVIAKHFLRLGERLLTSTVNEDDEDDDEY
jgi:hypothetical protein